MSGSDEAIASIQNSVKDILRSIGSKLFGDWLDLRHEVKLARLRGNEAHEAGIDQQRPQAQAQPVETETQTQAPQPLGASEEAAFMASSAVELPEATRVHHIRYYVPEADKGARLLTDAIKGAGVEYQAFGWETLESGAAVATLAVTEGQLTKAENAIGALCESVKGLSRESFDISPLETNMDLDKAIAEAKEAVEAIANPSRTIGREASAKTVAPDKGTR